MRYFCTGCRAEMDAIFLRSDGDGYLWCEKCKPALWLTAVKPKR